MIRQRPSDLEWAQSSSKGGFEDVYGFSGFERELCQYLNQLGSPTTRLGSRTSKGTEYLATYDLQSMSKS